MASDVDYGQIKAEILKSSLGRRTTLEVSHLLGYNFDQTKRWLIGQKEMRWDEFCDYCEALHLPLLSSLQDVFLFNGKSPEDCLEFLRFYREQFHVLKSTQELAETLGIHPSALKRYLLGDVHPPLELTLHLMDLKSNLLASWINKFLGVTASEKLLRYFERQGQQTLLETNWPIACAVENILLTTEYLSLAEHSPEWISQKLGLSLFELNVLWTELLAKGQIQQQGKHFKPTYTSINTNGASAQQVCKMVSFWTDRAKLRFQAPDHKPVNKNGHSLVAYRIASMSLSTAKQASEILLRAYNEICELAEQNPGPHEDVRAFVFHHFSVSDFPSDLAKETDKILDNSKTQNETMSS